MRRRILTPAIVLASLASLLVCAVFLLPVTPWLSPAVRPIALALSALWTVWRLFALDRALAHWRAWHYSPPWVIDPGKSSAPTRNPRGVFLGNAFRWNAVHTQELETALALDGALPVDEGIRGGHPALGAVGKRKAEPLVVPWTEMEGQTLLTGTNRSGKTRILENIIAGVLGG